MARADLVLLPESTAAFVSFRRKAKEGGDVPESSPDYLGGLAVGRRRMAGPGPEAAAGAGAHSRSGGFAVCVPPGIKKGAQPPRIWGPGQTRFERLGERCHFMV